MRFLKRLKHLPRPLVWLVVGVLWIWSRTLRVAIIDPKEVLKTGLKPPRIVVLWHNRLPLIPILVDRSIRRRIVFLASRSRDGGYIADLLAGFGFAAVRGSSSRGGAAALLELKRMAEEGFSLAITPDGPRGPRHAVQDGTIWLAAKTGLAVLPVSLNSSRRWTARSWDGTQFPVPFSRVELVIGEPIAVDGELDEASLCRWRERIRAGLLAAGREES